MEVSLLQRLERRVEVSSVEDVARDLLVKIEANRRAKAEANAKAAAEKAKPVVVEVVAPSKPKATAPRCHYKAELLRRAVAAGVDGIALVGPAGTGKTTAARLVAEEMKRQFEAVSFGPTTSKADLFGFVDANGTYRDTGLVRAARDGGVFLGDELDAGNPGVVVGLNMVTANPVFSTPAGMVTKHKGFVAVFGMNTVGTGANRQYVGRNQLDAASLDRLVLIDWDLDPGLEAAMIGIEGVDSPRFNVEEGGLLSPNQWLKRVWAVRKAVEDLGIRHIVSPRATQNGAKLFAAGVGKRWVEDGVLFKGLDRDTRIKVEAKAEIG